MCKLDLCRFIHYRPIFINYLLSFFLIKSIDNLWVSCLNLWLSCLNLRLSCLSRIKQSLSEFEQVWRHSFLKVKFDVTSLIDAGINLIKYPENSTFNYKYWKKGMFLFLFVMNDFFGYLISFVLYSIMYIVRVL